MTKNARALNWRPDVPDFRDLVFKSKVKPSLVPAKVDLRKKCSAVEDQGQLGSCTGNAIAGAIEVLERIKGAPKVEISRLFIYYNERVYEGTVGEDNGAFIRDGIKAIHKVGAADEALWPYDISRFALKPQPSAYEDALKRKFNTYKRITTLANMIGCLAEGYPFVFGFSVYSDFMSDRVARTGVVNMPGKGETMEGGHAVLAVGYNKATSRFIVRNSWGPGWGTKGYFTIPFAYLADRNLSDDMWTVRA